jgi:thiopeptide-type bacteriocin biosynthesis protein
VYLGWSGAPPDRQIDVNDLMLSLRGDKIVLRSKRLGKEIVPRLTTAHNTSYGTPGIYKFLSALQPQGVNPGALWNWGSLANLPYLPRVRHGDVYFTLQTWNVRRSEIKRIIEGDPDANFRAIQQWRVERNMPRLVGLVEGDNVLAIDFDNPLSVDAFTALIKYRRSISLREIPGPDELVVQGPEGHFQHELVIPFVKRRKVDGPDDAVGAPVVASKLTSLPSVFPPGSQWLYVKIYAGPATIDRLLVDVVRPLTDRLFKAGDATRWFFLRYYDPNPHLRLRYFGDPEALTASVLPDIHRALVPYVEKGLVWKIQVDTYDREVNRYGGSAAMDLCEDIFHADSDAVTHILGRYLGDESSDARWRLTFKGMDMLLDDLGFDIEQKYDVLLKASESFSREFRIAGRFRKAVLDKYRSERASLAELIRNGAAEEQPLSPGVADLARRSPKVAAAASGLRELAGRDELTNSLQNITSSLLHMHANRLLRWSQRAQESLIYNFLVREYDSQLARMGIKKLDRPS